MRMCHELHQDCAAAPTVETLGGLGRNQLVVCLVLGNVGADIGINSRPDIGMDRLQLLIQLFRRAGDDFPLDELGRVECRERGHNDAELPDGGHPRGIGSDHLVTHFHGEASEVAELVVDDRIRFEVAHCGEQLLLLGDCFDVAIALTVSCEHVVQIGNQISAHLASRIPPVGEV